MTSASDTGAGRTPGLPVARPMGESLRGVVLAALVLVVGCARMPEVQPDLSSAESPSVGRAEKGAGTASARAPEGDLERRLRSETARWLGTPHRMGGAGPEGVDCSGLVQRIYRDLLGVDLPRTTRELVRVGRAVGKDALKPGDLVFFRIPGKKLRHVGIYLGRGEFVHASTSLGVTASGLANPYWRKAYWTARRILGSGG